MALARVVRTAAFDRYTRKLFSVEEIEEIQAYLAERPESGDLVPGTGGLRKLRWAAKGRGKRGGARVLYYFHGGERLVFLLHVYAKSRQADIPAGELKEWKARLRELKKSLMERE